MERSTYRFVKVEILTPTHVGVSKDKHWTENIDFFIENGSIYQFKLLDYLEQNDTDEEELKYIISKMLAQELPYEKSELQNISREYVLENEGNLRNGIRPQIRTGLGIPYLPGSSLKGAIRSVLYGYLFELFIEPKLSVEAKQKLLLERIQATRHDEASVYVKLKESETWYKNLREDMLLGRFKNSLLRLIRVGDTEFSPESTSLVVNRIRSLEMDGEEWTETWKLGFDQTYEHLNVGAGAISRIHLAKEVHELVQKAAKRNPYIEQIPNSRRFLNIDGDIYRNVFNIINSQTSKCLQKEHKFFYDTGRNLTYLKELWRDIKQLRDQGSHSCVLRMASGSGFHSITGDWQNPVDHLTRTTKRKDGTLDAFNKTRRLAVDPTVDGEGYIPMGFVKLTLIGDTEALATLEAHQIEVDSYLKSQQEKLEHLKLEVRSENAASVPASRQRDSHTPKQRPYVENKPSEALPVKPPAPAVRPAVPEKFMGKVSKQSRQIPARVLSWAKGNAQVELMAEGLVDPIFKMNKSYNPIEAGVYILVDYVDINHKTVEYNRNY